MDRTNSAFRWDVSHEQSNLSVCEWALTESLPELTGASYSGQVDQFSLESQMENFTSCLIRPNLLSNLKFQAQQCWYRGLSRRLVWSLGRPGDDPPLSGDDDIHAEVRLAGPWTVRSLVGSDLSVVFSICHRLFFATAETQRFAKLGAKICYHVFSSILFYLHLAVTYFQSKTALPCPPLKLSFSSCPKNYRTISYLPNKKLHLIWGTPRCTSIYSPAVCPLLLFTLRSYPQFSIIILWPSSLDRIVYAGLCFDISQVVRLFVQN